MTIDDIRSEIDRLDDKLLKIFNHRADLALKIGAIKKESGLAVYDLNGKRRFFCG
jgi:chorismate mutase